MLLKRNDDEMQTSKTIPNNSFWKLVHNLKLLYFISQCARRDLSLITCFFMNIPTNWLILTTKNHAVIFVYIFLKLKTIFLTILARWFMCIYCWCHQEILFIFVCFIYREKLIVTLPLFVRSNRKTFFVSKISECIKTSSMALMRETFFYYLLNVKSELEMFARFLSTANEKQTPAIRNKLLLDNKRRKLT